MPSKTGLAEGAIAATEIIKGIHARNYSNTLGASVFLCLMR